uniref:Uncharacterized protein n=1 Tax=Clastoptera arizonana TaxID=38151 RepID=A0A1B6DZZ2_9HEMI
MLLLVHTVTMTLADIEMCAKFYHTLSPIPQRTVLTLVGKRIAVTFSKKKGLCRSFKHRAHTPRLRHNLQAITINGFCNGATAPSKDLTTIHDPSSTTVANVGQPERVADSSNSSMQQILTGPLPFNATAQQTSLWLQNNRFNGHLRSFSSFSGADLLRLSRDDLIQICGLADGIRLFNVLHTKAKTLYFCVQTSPIVYHAIYLASLSSREIISKLSKLLSISINQVHDVYLQGPGGIHVLVSDELVQNIKDEAMFMVEILPDHSSDRLRILLKPPSSN